MPRPGIDEWVSHDFFLEARDQTEPIESMGATVGSERMYRRGSEWCRRDERSDMLWLYEVCVDREAIVGVTWHYEDRGVETSLHLTRTGTPVPVTPP